MFNWFKTETERKRDEYYSLYEKIESRLTKHRELMKEVKEDFNAYKNSVPNFANNKIPSNDFDPVRERLTEEIQSYIAKEGAKTIFLGTAQKKAYERYEYYNQMAISEARIKKEKEEAELEKLRQKLNPSSEA